jgi:hypothetical protein
MHRYPGNIFAQHVAVLHHPRNRFDRLCRSPVFASNDAPTFSHLHGHDRCFLGRINALRCAEPHANFQLPRVAHHQYEPRRSFLRILPPPSAKMEGTHDSCLRVALFSTRLHSIRSAEGFYSRSENPLQARSLCYAYSWSFLPDVFVPNLPDSLIRTLHSPPSH